MSDICDLVAPVHMLCLTTNHSFLLTLQQAELKGEKKKRHTALGHFWKTVKKEIWAPTQSAAADLQVSLSHFRIYLFMRYSSGSW